MSRPIISDVNQYFEHYEHPLYDTPLYDDDLDDVPWDDETRLEILTRQRLENIFIHEHYHNITCSAITNIQVLNLLKDTRYYDIDIMNGINCTIHNAIADHNPIALYEYVDNGDRVIYLAKLHGATDYFVIKQDVNETALKHEAFVGLILNSFRTRIPNFVYTYGYDLQHPQKHLIFMEYISNSITFGDYIRYIDFDEYLNILLQVFLSLDMAYEEYDFTHYDLHLGNVLIRDPPAGKNTITYTLEGHTLPLTVNKVATIIDFDKSHIRFNGENFGSYHPEDDKKGISYHQSSPAHDMFKFISIASWAAQPIHISREQMHRVFSFFYQAPPELMSEIIRESANRAFRLPTSEYFEHMRYSDMVKHILTLYHPPMADIPRTFNDYIHYDTMGEYISEYLNNFNRYIPPAIYDMNELSITEYRNFLDKFEHLKRAVQPLPYDPYINNLIRDVEATIARQRAILIDQANRKWVAGSADHNEIMNIFEPHDYSLIELNQLVNYR